MKNVKKMVLVLTACMLGCMAMAQTDDPVVMKVNGKSVTRSEFAYSFKKNNADGVLDKKDVEAYVPMYVDFKLKVAAAEEARLDTISRIRKELDGRRSRGRRSRLACGGVRKLLSRALAR